MKRYRLAALVFGVLIPGSMLCPGVASSQTASVGIFTDESGSTCSFSGNNPGIVTAYIVARAGADGLRGLTFSAPVPSCFGGIYLGESAAPGFTAAGNSQTAVALTSGSCLSGTVHVLTLTYFRTGSTTPCCAYDVLPEPGHASIEAINCGGQAVAYSGLTGHFNADATCPCSAGLSPTVPSFPVPATGATAISITTALSWFSSDADGDLADFDVYLGTDPSPALVAPHVTVMTYQPSPLGELTHYFWKVVARDAAGHETPGPTWEFTTRLASSPPSPPDDPFPADGEGAASVKPLMSWTAFDLDNDLVDYDVYLGTDSTPPLAAAHVTTKSYHPSLDPLTHYYWRVLARDAAGHETSGPTWQFTTRIVNTPPTVPVVISPLDGASVTTTNGQVLLHWQSSDVDQDSLDYDVYFGDLSPPPLLVSHVNQTFWGTPRLTDKQFYWQIVVHDSFGHAVPGPVSSFSYHKNLPPSSPAVPYPPSGQSSVPTNVTLSWESIDPEGDPVTFDVYFGDYFGDPNLQPVATVGVPHYTPPFLQPGSGYNWFVIARWSSSTGNGFAIGPGWSFYTGPPQANTPSDPVPAYNAVTSITPTLQWSVANPTGEPLTFDVYFAGKKIGSTSQRSFTLPPLQSGQRYNWSIQSIGSHYAVNSPAWIFNTDPTPNQPPTAPHDPTPRDGSIAGLQVSFSWPPSTDPEGAPVTYKVYFGADNPPPFFGTFIEPNFVRSNLTNGVRYYWKVAASDGGNNVPGPVWSFVASDQPLPVLFTQFKAASRDDGVQLSWMLRTDEALESYTIYRHDGTSVVAVGHGQTGGSSGTYLDRSAEPGKSYQYELAIVTASQAVFRSQLVTATRTVTEVTLFPNHPNPFNPQTTISYLVPNASSMTRVRLAVYDAQGRLVRNLVAESQASGAHSATWNGQDDRGAMVASGIYFCVLQVGNERRTQKLVLLK